ncbi:helix-turn-helix domain-containing protein [Fodinibius sp. AD559]|uniref:helix-turn-helix domain-containing protein n=1 Tax=Fodinibius sp. AD559 TaxID=3424179 RepID=UPI004046E27F
MDTSEILTVEKFKSLMQEFISDIEAIVNRPVSEEKEWLRTKEAADYLSISSSQLHNLKAEGIISCTKLGGTNYYDRKEIDKVLEANKA